MATNCDSVKLSRENQLFFLSKWSKGRRGLRQYSHLEKFESLLSTGKKNIKKSHMYTYQEMFKNNKLAAVAAVIAVYPRGE